MAMAAVTVPMEAVPMETVQRAAEAALNGAAKGLAIGTRDHRQSGSATRSRDKARRYRADGGAAHQGQHDAA